MKSILLGAAVLLAFFGAAEARSYGSSHSSSGYHSRSSGERDYVSHGHYTNVSGHRVHSPTRTLSGRAPRNYTAVCGDGSYSFSEHHQGTCSHHGGVSTWH